MPLYAAYGSNMDPAQMKERAPHSPMAGTGWLVGWRLTFGGADYTWQGALSTVVPDPDSQVFVVLYDVTEQDAANLDRWEGGELGLHKKLRVRVSTLDGDVLVMVNGMGGTPLIELYVVFAEVDAYLREKGATITRRLVGNYCTSLEMQGFAVTVCRLNDRLTELWDAPVETPALRWGR